MKGYGRVKWTALFTMTPYSLHSRTPIRGLDDFKGKKIRTAGPIQAAIIESLGATPVGGMHIAKVAESLSRGVVDGTLAEWNGMVAFRIADAAKYHFAFPFTTVAVGTAMNKDSFAKHEFYAPTDAQRAEFRRRFAPIVDGWVAARPGRAELLAEARKIVASVRK